MGWERGRYYTRSKKMNGRVVREYVGGGELGALAAQFDEIERERRADEAKERRAVRDELGELAATLLDLDDRCEVLTRAALLVAGYRRHNRGEWRKRRVRDKQIN